MEKKPIYKKWWFWVIVIVVIGAIGSASNNKNPQPAQTIQTQQAQEAKQSEQSTQEQKQAEQPKPVEQQKEQQKPEKKDDSIKAGMYKVGKDISAEEYILFGDAMAYYQVSKDSTGSLDSIISNDTFNNNRYITLTEGQYIEFRNAKMLPVDKAPILKAVDGKYPEGMYKVGRDIQPGEYKVVPDGNGNSYIEVSKASTGTLDSIITNDVFEAEKYITIKSGQYIKLVGCYLVNN